MKPLNSSSTSSSSHRTKSSELDVGSRHRGGEATSSSRHRPKGDIDGSSRHRPIRGGELDGSGRPIRSSKSNELDRSSQHSAKSNGSNGELSNASGNGGTRRRLSTGMGGGGPKVSKNVHLKSKMMAGGHLVKKGSNKDLGARTSSTRRLKKKPPITMQGLHDAVSGIRPFVDPDSADAEKAMWKLDEAVDHLEKQLACLSSSSSSSPSQENQKPSLKVRYTMFVEDPTPEAAPISRHSSIKSRNLGQ